MVVFRAFSGLACLILAGIARWGYNPSHWSAYLFLLIGLVLWGLFDVLGSAGLND